MIDIRDKKGNIRYSVEVSERSVYHKELMAEEYVLLTFETDKLVRFRKGDYIETEFGRFEIITVDKPERNVGSDGGWSYEQKFCPAWAKWASRKMFYNRQKGSEKAWKMTQLPKYFMQILVDNIRDAGFGDWSYTIDASLTEMKLIEFDGTSLLDALSKIAETWETEWWITDNVIHLSRCEYGSPVVFEEGDVIQSMEREDGQDTDYITRLYAFGSTRNIPKDYRKNEDGDLVIEGVVEKRLKLPAGIDHVDAWEDMQPEDVVEGIVVFDEIYPHRIGTMSDITTKEYKDKVEQEDGSTEEVTWYAYRFKDTGIKFSKEYVIPGEELRITFQSGTLAGMDFVVKFNPDGLAESDSRAQLWEIVRNEDYGVELPSENFKPSNGDKYILYGYNSKLVSDQLIPTAEQELLAKAHETILKKSQDKYIYNCPTDPIRCAGYKERNGKMVYLPSDVIDLDIGQSVELRNEAYFDSGYRVSRVHSFEKRLDNRYNCTYTVGESAGYSNSTVLEEKVEAITYQNTQFVSGGGGVYVIKRHDGTTPSDHNVYSALRSLAIFLRKDKEDTTNYLLNLLGGVITPFIQSPDFVSGALGTGFTVKKNADGTTYAEIDKMMVRMKAIFQVLEIMRTEAGGATMVFNASGARITVTKVERIDSVPFYYSDGAAKYYSDGARAYVQPSEYGAVYRCYFLADDGDTAVQNLFKPGHLARSQSFNIKAGVHEGVSNRSYWRLVTAVGDNWIDLSVSHCAAGSDIPQEGDVICQIGDISDPDYQSAIVMSAFGDGAPYMTFYQGINSYSLSGKDVFTIGYDRAKQECFIRGYGRMYFGDRERKSYIEYTKEDGLHVKASKFLLESGTDLGESISGIKQDVNGITLTVKGVSDDVSGIKSGMSEIRQSVSGISLKVQGVSDDVSGIKSGLSATGIDIDSKTVSVTASQFLVKDNSGRLRTSMWII